MDEMILTLAGVAVQLAVFAWYMGGKLARIEAALGLVDADKTLKERVEALERAQSNWIEA